MYAGGGALCEGRSAAKAEPSIEVATADDRSSLLIMVLTPPTVKLCYQLLSVRNHKRLCHVLVTFSRPWLCRHTVAWAEQRTVPHCAPLQAPWFHIRSKFGFFVFTHARVRPLT